MNRIYISRSGDGYRNLAADEYLLEQYRRGKAEGVTLYFYVNDCAVIIGRNQNAWRECRVEKMEKDGVQLVRRHTGGGAVYHDGGNLNFSFISNEKNYDKDRFDRVLVNAMRRAGIEAEVNGRNDLTVNGCKFSGCAYALRGIARGMHGTVLVSADMSRLAEYLVPSKAKLAAKGISSVRSRVVNISDLAPVTVGQIRDLITEAFAEEFGGAEELEFTPGDEAEIGRLAAVRGSWEWRLGMAPAFDYTIEGRYSFGEAQIHLRIKNGAVAAVKVYTDALDTELAERIERLISGARFDEKELIAALRRGGKEENEVADCMERERTMKESAETLAVKARHDLHALAELSLCETNTKAYAMRFIEEHTDLAVFDRGRWFFAEHNENAAETVAVRADMDAVPAAGGAKHLCGHDGHTASLLCLALMLTGRRVGKNVILLFQHAEETGDGAKECCALFEEKKIDRIIGCHNIPGSTLGKVLMRRGTFACASCGIEISLSGSPTHAAYPENGNNPTAAAAQIVLELPRFAENASKKHGCMTLATIVGMRTGERAFGVAASDGSIWATLRSEKTSALEELVASVRTYAEKLAKEHALDIKTELFDVFPATVNDERVLDRAENTLKKQGIPVEEIPVPFRWSEDFGHYGKHVPALFFGIGSGEDTAPLHTKDYEYPDGLIMPTARAFMAMIEDPGDNIS